MFSFVKSLFTSVSQSPEDESDTSSSVSSSESSEEEDNRRSRSSLGSDVEEKLSPCSLQHRGGRKQSIQSSSSSHHNEVPHESDVKGAAYASPETTQPDSHGADGESLVGALYLVEGLNFQCVMPRCEADFDGRLLVFTAIENERATSKRMMLRIDRISYVRQHLIDAFQFLVREAKEGGEEYGFQLESLAATLAFRKLLYSSLLDTCTPIVEIECAIAEYDTKNKEFVILTKAAVARILRRSCDNDHYFTVADPGEDSADERLIFCDYLTKEIQIWPSPQSNQITFWGPRFQKQEIDKTMFLMEMDPGTVGVAKIEELFHCFASVLKDNSFLYTTKVSEGYTKDQDTVELMEDDGFDIGPTGDPTVCTEWRRRSHYRRSSVASDRSSESNDTTEDDVYQTGYPIYAKSDADESLIHRFMEVGSTRTFVCRGNQSATSNFYGRHAGANKLQLKVYKREEGDEEDVLETVGAIDGKKFTYQGTSFAPSKGLLHQQERKLLLVPEHDQRGDVYMMDLEAETVVQKWNADGTAIDTMFPTIKKGQTTHDPTFLCTNPRNLFMMDTRAPHGSAKSTSYSYTTNPQLSVGATDEKGHILVGSRLGELRLYDGEASATTGGFKRAKTLLQTIKEPITAVDVTADGSWIVATTKTFLVVFPTRLQGDGRTGFETCLGQHKPTPRYLMLSAEDLVKYGITEIDFAPARFDAEEDSIVTSTGNMAVVWDFGTVKRGRPFYSVRFATDTIKDVQIATDSANVVVLALFSRRYDIVRLTVNAGLVLIDGTLWTSTNGRRNPTKKAFLSLALRSFMKKSVV